MRFVPLKKYLLIALALVLIQQSGLFGSSAPAREQTSVTSAQPSAVQGPAVQHATESATPGAPQSPSIAPVLIAIVIMLAAGKLGGELFERFKQPAVLGELLAGILLGNLALVGIHGLDFFHNDAAIHALAEIGVILLLFEVGLESDVKRMAEVGLSSFLVAAVGVVAPFLLGWFVAAKFIPEEATLGHVFIGATLTATSVGITARVLKDLRRIDTKEARIILGAAVIDDVMGLVILALVQGLITASASGAHLAWTSIALIVLKALVFLAGAIWIGQLLAPKIFWMASRLRVHGMLLLTSILFCFGLAFIASAIDLAPIVGAFAAGLVLDPVHYRDHKEKLGDHTIEELILPLTTFLVPLFFVLTGIHVDLSSLARVEILAFAGVLTLAAIAGKQACAFAVVERGLNRFAVGIGMIPRGEVGLIFANIGATLFIAGERVVSPSTFSAVVIMVMVTTLVTPPILKWSMTKHSTQ